MSGFDGVVFKGKFRNYQQAVLDSSAQHLHDGHIHIVAAPGSGKTILGLELIRRLGTPTLVFSPSVTIRQQWGERWQEMFLPDGARLEDYVSYDLKKPAMITSVTYQALHAAWNRAVSEETEDEDSFEAEASTDFTGFDLLAQMRKVGVGVICLDEAHHLRSEWQKALESFVAALKSQVRVIALTATPPYDSTLGEWNRYVAVCGEIDDEIFVPQLVAQKNLCPHQDYIYFNYPEDAEIAALRDFRTAAKACADEVISGPIFGAALAQSGLPENWEQNIEKILDNVPANCAMLTLAKRRGLEIPKALVRLICPRGVPDYTPKAAETAFNYILTAENVFSPALSEKLRARLAADGLIERRKACLTSTDKLDKMLITSVGKLHSIEAVTAAECAALGEKLRMLVLTDYIKKDMIKLVGTDKPLTALGTVPVFEAIRRSAPPETRIGLLSGTLVILPQRVMLPISKIAKERDVGFSPKQLADTDYCEVAFTGSNKNKVAVITEALKQGLLHILVGTKSLLGEGWDSPCINSLILASFVGSYMLSNQMRGRAIRTDKAVPDKTADIWHLVTVEPPELFEDKEGKKAPDTVPPGQDFATLARRFEGFLAPAYSAASVESGIGRIDIIKPPFDAEGIEKINARSRELAADRAGMANSWSASVKPGSAPEILDVCEAPVEVRPAGFVFTNALKTVIWAVIALLLGIGASVAAAEAGKNGLRWLALLGAAVAAVFVIIGLVRTLCYLTPAAAAGSLAKAICGTLRDMGLIASKNVRVSSKRDKLSRRVCITLSNATVKEKNIFSSACSELMSAIDDPRYVLIKKGQFLFWDYRAWAQSYACPSVIAVNKESVALLAKRLARTAGGFEAVYTRSEEGRKILLRCRKSSYLNRSGVKVTGKKIAKAQ